MLNEPTMEKLLTLRLNALAAAWTEQQRSPDSNSLCFDERLGLLVDAEWIAREQRKLAKRLRAAKLRYPASIEDVDFKHPRGLDRQQVLSLGNCGFVHNRHNLVITGPTEPATYCYASLSI